MLERLIGHARFAAIFAFSALSGSVLGLLVNPPNVVGIGASGGIVGLLAAVFVVSFRVATESARKKIKWRAFCTLVFVFLPASSASGIRIDYAAHLGGLIGGVAITSMMLRSWPQDRTNRRTAYPMAALAAAFFAIAAFSVIPIFQQHRFFPLYQELTPDWPSDFIEAKRRSLAAIAEHPRDPRPHFAHAAVLAEAKDLDGAEREMRVILADQDMLALPRFQVLDRNVRYLLSRLLLDTHRHDEAREIASPLCGVTLRPEMQQHFERVALCEPKA
jgi:hypothetical protein